MVPWANALPPVASSVCRAALRSPLSRPGVWGESGWPRQVGRLGQAVLQGSAPAAQLPGMELSAWRPAAELWASAFQDSLVYVLNRERHTVGQRTPSSKPSISLSAPDILPLHCTLRRRQPSGQGPAGGPAAAGAAARAPVANFAGGGHPPGGAAAWRPAVPGPLLPAAVQGPGAGPAAARPGPGPSGLRRQSCRVVRRPLRGPRPHLPGPAPPLPRPRPLQLEFEPGRGGRAAS